MSLSFCAVVFCGFDCVMAFLLYARWVQIPVRSVDEALQTITGMLPHDLLHVRFRVLQKYRLGCTYTDEWIRNWTKDRISRGKNSSYKGFPGIYTRGASAASAQGAFFVCIPYILLTEADLYDKDNTSNHFPHNGMCTDLPTDTGPIHQVPGYG